MPTNTGNANVDGFAVSESNTGVTRPSSVFDKNEDSFYRSSINPSTNEYIQVSFPKAYLIGRYSLTTTSGYVGNMLKKWEIHGLSDGKWIVLHAGSQEAVAGTVTFDFTPTLINGVRIVLKERYGANSWFLNEAEFFEVAYSQKILLEHEGIYKTYNATTAAWEIISSVYPTEEQFINQGIDATPGKDISIVYQLPGAKILYYTDSGCTSIEKHDDVQAFSVYDYISEFPVVVAYSEIDEDIIITTTTEPFTIYDEFVDENGEPGEIEILYYTDDPNTTGAELSITENWSPLDELEGDKELVVWTSEENAQRSLRIEGLLPEAFTHLDYWIDVENLVGMNIAATGEPAPFAIQKEGDPKYYSFYQGHFFELPVNERMFSNYGLRPTAVNAITQQQWKPFLGNVKKIRLLYMFSNQSIGTKSISTSLDVIHTVGTIKILREIRKTTPTVSQFQIEISKYSMQGRMEEIERINLNNLMALEMRTALLLNAAELKMHEMIIETFDDNDYEIPRKITDTVWHETNMTSNNSPSPLMASASSTHSTSGGAWQAFDNKTSTKWMTVDKGGHGQWIEIDFGRSVYIDTIKLTARPDSYFYQIPVKMFLKYSEDRINWNESDRFLGVEATKPSDIQTHRINRIKGRFIRLVAEEARLGSNNQYDTGFGEIKYASNEEVNEPSKYNTLTRQFEGDFILEVPMHVPDYASKLYVQGNGESYRMWIRDGVKSIEVIDVFNDTIDLATFNRDQLYVRIEGAGGNMSAIAYAWQ